MPTLVTTQKAIWRNLLSTQMKQSHWLLCVAKNCDWPTKITSLSNLTRKSLLVEWKLTVKAELNYEICKSKRKCWKSQVSFCHQSSPVSRKAWMLSWILQEFKKYARKLSVAVNTGGHSIQGLDERSVSDGGNLCPLWMVILKSVWYSVGDTLELGYSWPWSVVSSTFLDTVPWNELEHSCRKTRLNLSWSWSLFVYLNWWCFDV